MKRSKVKRKATAQRVEEDKEVERKTTAQRVEEEDSEVERKATAQSVEEEEVEREPTAQRVEEEKERKAITTAERCDEEKATSSSNGRSVPGIIYLGHIPPRFRPKHLRNMLSVYGEIGRVFLQPEDTLMRKRKKKSGLRRCDFTEGWVEFRDKRVAKRVAASLHNTPMGTKKRQRFFSDLWSIKYLHRFQWTHLSERLAYEQMVLQQRLRAEVSQAKKETNFYLNNVEKSARLDKLKRKRQRDGQQVEEKTWDFTQKQTEEEIQMKKKRKKDTTQKQLDKARLIQQRSQSNVSLLTKIFNSNQSQ